MASKPPVAVLDACVLYPFHLRNVLIQAAFDGLFDARWTDAIHDEWIHNLAANTAGVSRERLEVTHDKMMAVLPEADVTGFQALIPSLNLPDPDDRHVLAAAIVGKASVIVTWNMRDFPAASLQSHGVASISPDAFLMSLHASFPAALIDSAARARDPAPRGRAARISYRWFWDVRDFWCHVRSDRTGGRMSDNDITWKAASKNSERLARHHRERSLAERRIGSPSSHGRNRAGGRNCPAGRLMRPAEPLDGRVAPRVDLRFEAGLEVSQHENKERTEWPKSQSGAKPRLR